MIQPRAGWRQSCVCSFFTLDCWKHGCAKASSRDLAAMTCSSQVGALVSSKQNAFAMPAARPLFGCRPATTRMPAANHAQPGAGYGKCCRGSRQTGPWTGPCRQAPGGWRRPGARDPGRLSPTGPEPGLQPLRRPRQGPWSCAACRSPIPCAQTCQVSSGRPLELHRVFFS